MNLFELYAKVTLDTGEYEKSLKDASDKTSSFGEKLKAGVGAAAKATAAGITAAATAIGALTKASVEGYANYEQLVGGIETLYGASYASAEEYAQKTGASLEFAQSVWEKYASRQEDVLNNAANAYQTAGMSANEYMETVSGFAASLNASLGEYQWQSANYADMIITDMSDNANKMGTDIESIKNAYAGFAKGNFTMLDNLKIGYGGTKEEMERLLRDAEQLEGLKVGSLSIDSFADMADAIHIVQENLGITGTTAKEAATTIQGSVSAAKAAWENLAVGMADDTADMDTLIGNFTSSVATAAGNILPRVEQSLSGIGELVTKLSPIISDAIPQLVETTLPSMLDAGVSLLDGVITGLIGALPTLAESAVDIIMQLSDTLTENLPTVMDAAVEVILALANGIAENLPELTPTVVEVVITIVDELINNVDLLIDASLALITGLAEGLITSLPTLVAKAPEIVSKLVSAIVTNAPKLLTSAAEIITQLVSGIVDDLPRIGEAAGDIIETVGNGIRDLVTDLRDTGKNIVDGIWQGIKDAKDEFFENVKGFFDGVVSGVKELLGIHSPSTVFAEIGENMAAGVDVGFTRRMEETAKSMKKAFNSALHGLDAEDFDPNKSAAGIMALAIATGDTSLTSMLGEYDTFAELAAGLEERTGMTSSALYDRMIATQTADEDAPNDIDTSDALSAATATVKTSTSSGGSSSTELLKSILAKLDRIYVYLDGDKLVGALQETMDGSLGGEFALAVRGGLG